MHKLSSINLSNVSRIVIHWITQHDKIQTFKIVTNIFSVTRSSFTPNSPIHKLFNLQLIQIQEILFDTDTLLSTLTIYASCFCVQQFQPCQSGIWTYVTSHNSRWEIWIWSNSDIFISLHRKICRQVTISLVDTERFVEKRQFY